MFNLHGMFRGEVGWEACTGFIICVSMFNAHDMTELKLDRKPVLALSYR